MRGYPYIGPFRRFFESRLFLFAVIVLLAVVALSYARAYYQNYQVQQEIRALEEEVSRLQRKKLESMEILQYVQSDVFVEEVARKELNLQKPGEHVVVVRGGDVSQTSEKRLSDAGQSLSNPIKWWYYFTNPDAILE